MLSLLDWRRRFPRDLSGGMRKRAAIARVLALDAPILLMDEPFGALDAPTRRQLQEALLHVWSALGKTILFVTHDVDEALCLADRIVVMTGRPGKVRHDLPVDLPRMRDPASPQFKALARELGAMVMEGRERHHVGELRAAAVD